MTRNVKESELSTFPECLCVYYYNYRYMIIEVNTGVHLGSIKPISESYKSISELMNNFDSTQSIYKMLDGVIVIG